MVDDAQIEHLARELLKAIGEDPHRDGIKDTPARFAKWWKEFIDYDPGKIETSFSGEHVDNMVAVTGMQVWSLCEHHLLPFTATVSIAYIPANGSVLGLSKFARIAHKYAHRLQIQERMTDQIAKEISKQTGSEHVAVVVDGEHSCMSRRGIRTSGTMRTSVMLGDFRSQVETRQEFLSVVDK